MLVVLMLPSSIDWTITMNATIVFLKSLTSMLLAVAVMSSVSKHAFGSDEAEAELIAIEKALAASVVNFDFVALNTTYADDFIFTHSNGSVDTKEDWLTFLRSGNVSYTERSVDSIEVEMHGNIAVTTGRMHIKTNLIDPRRQEFTIWYVRVYERRDDLWQLLSHRSIQQETGPLTD